MYSFCADPIAVMNEGKSSGYHLFTGPEQLVINFVSSLSASVQVDIIGYNEAVIEISKNAVEKKNFAL
jgi:hypothetical protein